MRPITKWNARLRDAGDHPRGRAQGVQGRRVREAGRDAHRAARGRDGGARSTPRRCRAGKPAAPEPQARELLRGGRPDPRRAQPGRARRQRRGPRRRAAGAARVLRATGIPVAETFMGKGAARPDDDPKALGAVGLQAGDYAMAGFDDADVVIAIGYDLVEHAPEHWNPKRDKKIICIDSVAGRDRRALHPRGRAGRRPLPRSSRGSAEECRARAPPGRLDPRCATSSLGRFEAATRRRRLPGAAAARAVGDPPGARPRRHPDLRRRAAQALDRRGCSRPTSRTRC